MRRTLIGLALLAGLPFVALAEPSQEWSTRIQHLEKAVLAPCCYTEPVGQHQSEIAVRMRVEIAKWVAEGRSDAEILDTYSARYGAKVLVNPNTIPRDWTLIVPWALCGLGTLGAAWMVWRWRAARLAAPAEIAVAPLPDLPELEDY
jgi:cytochrome c-type biogenesis protein CcmH/NrfF